MNYRCYKLLECISYIKLLTGGFNAVGLSHILWFGVFVNNYFMMTARTTELKDPENSKETSQTMEFQTKANKSIEALKELCINNAGYFSKDSSENGQRLYISFLAIIDALDLIWPKVSRIQAVVAEYDFDSKTPGNGYRSFLNVFTLTLELATALGQKVMLRRDSMLFRKTALTKDVESCSQIISSLDTCFKHLETLISWSKSGELFPSEVHSPQELLAFCDDVNQYCFYGRSIGFQFCDSLKNVLQFIVLSMAIFSEAYYSQGSLFSKATNSVMTTTKYLTDPEQRARRIVNISQNADVDFCKAFWFLSESELMGQLPSMVSPSVSVCKIISIPPEPFSLNVNGREIDIPVPSAHIGPKHVQVRLISSKIREGMMGAKFKRPISAPSRGLILHCHGGGFVAQSSKSHEGYLRDWAKHIDVPILSIDYSLAPEAPYPRAVEEVFYAYCWALKHHSLLGSTGEKIIFAGDSAGANLMLATTLKCIHSDIPLPAGVFVAYVPTVVNFLASPARLLCLMDPLLPFGFLMRCLKAYACADPNLRYKDRSNGSNSDTESFEEISESDLLELQAHKSPTSDASDTLTFGSLTDEDKDRDNLNISDIEKSQKNVADYLEKYVLESDTETDGTKISTSFVKPESSSSSSIVDSSLQTKISALVTNIRSQFTSLLGSRTFTGADRCLDVNDKNSLIEEFRFTVPNDPYLSPYFAADEDLKRFPPTSILSVHLDPCLDDCVMFARKLRNLGGTVKLDVLSGLPHGFLNFSLISKDAYEGSKVCMQRINELLNLDDLPPLNNNKK